MPNTLNIDLDSIKDLGKVHDRIIATRLGCSISWVANARKKKNIPSYASRAQRIDWDSVPLGKKIDRKIGEELGVSHQIVRAQRKKRGIPSFIKDRQRQLREVPIEILMKRGSCNKLARQFGYNPRTISELRVSIDPSLGVRGLREQHNTGNPFFRAKRQLESGDKVQLELTTRQKLIEELPTTWGIVLAEKYGMHLSVIQRMKERAGIETKYTQTRTCICGKEFQATTRVHIHCGEECRDAYSELRAILNTDKGEVTDPTVFRMFLQLIQKLRSKVKYIQWSNRTDELFNTDVKELSARYGLCPDHFRHLRKSHRQRQQQKGMINETPQTQPANDPTR